MKNPDPNEVAILKAILDAQGPPSISSPGIYSLNPILFPAIFHDDCSGTEPYTTRGTGADWTIAYATAAAYVGLNGLEITTKTTTPAVSDYAEAKLHMPYNRLPIIRFQCLLARAADTSGDFKTIIDLFADNELFKYAAQIEIVWQTPSIAYWKKTNGTWSKTVIAGWHPNYQDKGWNHIQLAINMDTLCYHEIIMNGKVLSIPTELLSPGVSQTWSPCLTLELETMANANAQASTIFDQILVTAEEA